MGGTPASDTLTKLVETEEQSDAQAGIPVSDPETLPPDSIPSEMPGQHPGVTDPTFPGDEPGSVPPPRHDTPVEIGETEKDA